MSLCFPQGPPSLRRVSNSHSRGWAEPTYQRKVLLTRTYEHLPILLKNGFRSKAVRAVRPGRPSERGSSHPVGTGRQAYHVDHTIS